MIPEAGGLELNDLENAHTCIGLSFNKSPYPMITGWCDTGLNDTPFLFPHIRYINITN
jgi:hypothetical protein